MACKHIRVVSWVPVPNAIPGSTTSTIAGWSSGKSAFQLGRTTTRSDTRVGLKNCRQLSAQLISKGFPHQGVVEDLEAEGAGRVSIIAAVPLLQQLSHPGELFIFLQYRHQYRQGGTGHYVFRVTHILPVVFFLQFFFFFHQFPEARVPVVG